MLIILVPQLSGGGGSGQALGALAALAGATRAPASEAPPLAQMLDRLDGLDRGALLRAQVVPDISGILAGDPLAALTGGAAGGAAARWESMLLADFSTGAESTAVLVLSVHWPDDAALEPLAQSVATLWQARASASGRTFAERLGAPVTVDATRVSGGRALLRLSVTVPTTESVADLPVNRAFEILLSAYAMRDMTFLP